MKKPWSEELKGKSLEAFVGVHGIRTSALKSSEDLVDVACFLYDLVPQNRSVDAVAEEISSLSKKERSRRAHSNRDRLIASQVPGPEHRHSADSLEQMMDNARPKLIEGKPFGCEGTLDVDPAKLLQKVVTAVINHGQAHILYDYPDVLAFFGSRIPNRDEVISHQNVDERAFQAKENWPNKAPG